MHFERFGYVKLLKYIFTMTQLQLDKLNCKLKSLEIHFLVIKVISIYLTVLKTPSTYYFNRLGCAKLIEHTIKRSGFILEGFTLDVWKSILKHNIFLLIESVLTNFYEIL